LKNNAPAPFPGGGEVVPTEVMMFRVVKPLSSPDTSEISSVLNPVPNNFDPRAAVRTRNLTLSELDRAAPWDSWKSQRNANREGTKITKFAKKKSVA
jgi:hypothetical protein